MLWFKLTRSTTSIWCRFGACIIKSTCRQGLLSFDAWWVILQDCSWFQRSSTLPTTFAARNEKHVLEIYKLMSLPWAYCILDAPTTPSSSDLAWWEGILLVLQTTDDGWWKLRSDHHLFCQRHLDDSTISESYFVIAKNWDQNFFCTLDVIKGHWTTELQSRIWKSTAWTIC